MSTPALDLFARLAEAFGHAGLDHGLIGGHAVNVWAEPRFTADIDFTVVADAHGLERLRACLERDGWRIERQHGENLPSGPDFIRFVHPDQDAPVELQVAKTALQRRLVERARARADCGGLKIATVEDLLVLKLIAFRAKDQADLAALAARPDVDWRYVEEWATAWEVGDRLRRLRAVVGAV